MRLATIKVDKGERAAVVTSRGAVTVERINHVFKLDFPLHLLNLLESGRLDEMRRWFEEEGGEKINSLKPGKDLIPGRKVVYSPLYREPVKIWGIGLNYTEHAGDLSERTPRSIPASFIKASTTIIGAGDKIRLPVQSEKTTGEAELGIVFKKECRGVGEDNWMDVVAGFTNIIDMTAEDILRRNPRYLTLSKNFDTFFSFGPHLVTPDEIRDVLTINVATVINGKIHARNSVSNMIFPPPFLVSFHCGAMTMHPGDIISTGTPRAVELSDGDEIECRIDGLEPLVNGVIDQKKLKQEGDRIWT